MRMKQDQAWSLSIFSSWKSLIAHIEKMFDQMQSRVTVEFTPEDPYKNEKELIQDIEQNKRLKIYSGHADHPVWSKEQNLKFRAYHDYLSHLLFSQRSSGNP